MRKPAIRRRCSITVSTGGPLRRSHWWVVEYAGTHKSFPDWNAALDFANLQSCA